MELEFSRLELHVAKKLYLPGTKLLKKCTNQELEFEKLEFQLELEFSRLELQVTKKLYPPGTKSLKKFTHQELEFGKLEFHMFFFF